MEHNRPLYRAAAAAALAGIPVTRLRKLADAGLPVSCGTAAGEHRRWCERDIFIVAVAAALMSGGMSATTAASLLRPHLRWLLSIGEPTHFDITSGDGSVICRIQLAEIANALRDRLTVLAAATSLLHPAPQRDAA